MRWRPRGRIVDSKLNFLTVDLTRRSTPKGRPRCVDKRTASCSLSLSGRLILCTQPGNLGMGQGESSFGSGPGFCSQRHNDPHLQSSAR